MKIRKIRMYSARATVSALSVLTTLWLPSGVGRVPAVKSVPGGLVFCYGQVTFLSGFEQAAAPQIRDALVILKCWLVFGHTLPPFRQNRLAGGGHMGRVLKRDKSVLEGPPEQHDGSFEHPPFP